MLEDGMPVYEYMGDFARNGAKNCPGNMATAESALLSAQPIREQLTALRKKLPHTFFLVPGYGAQGGGAADVAGGFDQNGLGAIINASRSIMYAYKKEGCDEKDYAAAARREAIRMRNEIMAHISGNNISLQGKGEL